MTAKNELMVKKWLDNFYDDVEFQDILLSSLQEIKKGVENLQACIANNNYIEFKNIIHNIKGLSGTMKIIEIYELSSYMNAECSKNNFSFNSIKVQFNDLVNIIDSIPQKYFYNT